MQYRVKATSHHIPQNTTPYHTIPYHTIPHTHLTPPTDPPHQLVHTPHHITSHHITSHHITHHITSHHITSHHITSHHITSHHITTQEDNTYRIVISSKDMLTDILSTNNLNTCLVQFAILRPSSSKVSRD